MRSTAVVFGVVMAIGMACGPVKRPAPPPANITPKYPAFPTPDVPAALRVPQDVRDGQAIAWRRLQAGDPRGAQRDFNELLKRDAAFFPAETGLGYVLLADRQYQQAATRFTSALKRNDRYLPAWYGQAEAQLGLEHDAEAMTALERVLALDPKREDVRTRLELLRFRELQGELESARRARQAGRLTEAQTTLERALKMAPTSNLILRELAIVETARGALEAAEAHARKAIQVEPNDAEAHAALGAALAARGRYRDASAAYANAAAIDPKPAWRELAASLREKATDASIPPEFRAIPTAPTVTRGQLAAIIGIQLDELIAAAPKRPATVATDVRSHWAANWILPVTQAGVMDVYANHTFQPSVQVRRSDLAQVASQLLTLAAGAKSPELARWRAARPAFVDLPATHLSYAAAAVAVASGVMTAHAGDRFAPTRLATGREVTAAIARLEHIASR